MMFKVRKLTLKATWNDPEMVLDIVHNHIFESVSPDFGH